MSASEETLRLLRSIDALLKLLVRQQQGAASTGGAVATDRDLDSKWGDPVLRFSPRDWTGASCKGRRMSECPPELLDIVAETFEYFARQSDEKDERTDKGKPVADYKRQDAARARGWAARIRSGRHIQTHETEPAETGGFASEEDGEQVHASGMRW